MKGCRNGFRREKRRGEGSCLFLGVEVLRVHLEGRRGEKKKKIVCPVWFSVIQND